MTKPLRIGLISDTHIPDCLPRLPERIWRVWGELDLVLHAGDYTTLETLEYLRQRIPTYGVAGNMDAFRDEEECPHQRVVEVGPWRIGLIHGWGGAEGMAARIAGRFANLAVHGIVHGHSHEPAISRVGEVLVVNPGSLMSRTGLSRATVGRLTLGTELTAEILEL